MAGAGGKKLILQFFHNCIENYYRLWYDIYAMAGGYGGCKILQKERIVLNMKKPLIGITGSILAVEQGSFSGMERSYVNRDYVLCVERLGGIPVILPNIGDGEMIEAQLKPLDGVVLSGGYDIDPLLYGEEPILAQDFTYTQIDEYYMAVIHLCQRLGKPILGICKGCQALNVAFGGTLYQDLASQNVTLQRHSSVGPRQNPSHEVVFSEEARFFKFLHEAVRVNSFHHQAIHRVAEGFLAVGRARDGVVEAIEKAEGTFAAGVQWHPEMMAGFGNPEMELIFKKFFELCGKEL